MKVIRKWKTLGSEYLFRKPWLTARRDTVEMPDGRVVSDFYILEYPTWVNVIAITPEGLYVTVRQYRHGLRDVFTELCAGCVEEGEKPEDAARRELMEETGYAGGTWRLLDVLSPNPTANTNLCYCFVAEGVTLQGQQHLDATEDIAVELKTRSEMFSLLKSNSLVQAMMAAPLWHHFFETSTNHERRH